MYAEVSGLLNSSLWIAYKLPVGSICMFVPVMNMAIQSIFKGKIMFMTDEEINDYYDSHPNLLLSQLSRITGKSVEELKRILMPDYYQSN
jgi:hypothetical protein